MKSDLRARQLRKTATEAEQKLWQVLRDRRLCGWKFRRQVLCGPYVLDFYCHEQRLAIEVDGGQHNQTEQHARDRQRTDYLQAQGLRVMRYWNNDVLQNLTGVLEHLRMHMTANRDTSPHPDPLPGGEGNRQQRRRTGASGSRSEGEENKNTHHRFAAFDLGTNSLRMLVAECDGAQVRPLWSRLDACRIGAGLRQTGHLSAAGCARALATLQAWLADGVRDGIVPVGGIATEAVRKAADGEVFLATVRAATGITFELISGEREAELTRLGVCAALPELPGELLIADIGGGSTELIHRDGKTVAVSVPVGSVVLHEDHLQHDPPRPEEMAALRAAARVALAPHAVRGLTVVGVGGTVTTLAALAQALPQYDPRAVHGAHLSARHVTRLTALLAGMTAAQRALFPGLTENRADIIVAGALILGELLDLCGAAECVVSDNGILLGYLADYAARA